MIEPERCEAAPIVDPHATLRCAGDYRMLWLPYEGDNWTFKGHYACPRHEDMHVKHLQAKTRAFHRRSQASNHTEAPQAPLF